MIDPTRSPAWAKSLARAQRQFADDLETAGFTEVPEENCWEGEIEVATLAGGTASVDLKIEVGDAFPFEPPKVTDMSLVSTHTWHHNQDWSLCLYGRRGVADRPWQSVGALLSRIQDWFENASRGWPDDPPDLDLERYFDSSSTFVTYDNIDQLVGNPVSASDDGKGRLHIVGIDRTSQISNRRPKRGKPRRKRLRGWVGDIGSLDAPVFDWPSIHARLGRHASAVSKSVKSGEYEFLLLRYHRGDHAGAIALFPAVVGKDVQLRAGVAAANDERTRRLRAGAPRTVAALQRRSVAIVGVGAVGSFLADNLARAGIGRLHLVDPDVLRPGNCIRHLVGYDRIGQPKIAAVHDTLIDSELMDSATIKTTHERLGPCLAADLLEENDVVVDATADDNVRSLLAHLHEVAQAHDLDTRVVSVAVHRSGSIVRTDRWPRVSNNAPAPIPVHPDGEIELREGGCGEPVSSTPASAVAEAAGLAGRQVVDLLVGTPALPDSIIQILIPQPDAPYQELGTLTQ